MLKNHRTSTRVLFGDVDAMNIVYYANYLRFFEMGRAELMREAGGPYPELAREGMHLPVTQAQVKYVKPAYYDDELIIETHVDWVKRASCQFGYTIYKTKASEEILSAKGFTAHGCVNMEGKVVPLPEWTRKILKSYTD